jgi:hypothetical protein
MRSRNCRSPSLRVLEIRCIQNDRSLNFAILQQTMPFGCFTQRQNARDGWRQLLVRCRFDQEFQSMMDEIRFGKIDRQVKPS